MSILGADRAAEAIIQSPNAMRSPAETIKRTHKALVKVLGGDDAAATILTKPYCADGSL